MTHLNDEGNDITVQPGGTRNIIMIEITAEAEVIKAADIEAQQREEGSQ